MLRKAAAGATLLLLLTTGVVSAQVRGISPRSDRPPSPKEQREKEKAIDRDYQSTLKRIPDAGKKDPWGDIRPPPPAAAKNKQ